jgi:hypothetical protein
LGDLAWSVGVADACKGERATGPAVELGMAATGAGPSNRAGTEAPENTVSLRMDFDWQASTSTHTLARKSPLLDMKTNRYYGKGKASKVASSLL